MQKRPLLPTIATTRESVSAYWDDLPHAPGELLPQLDDALDALDGYLAYQLFEYLPANGAVVDLAAAVTRGATTALALSHPARRTVYSAPVGPAGESIAATLRAFAAHVKSRIEFLTTLTLPAKLPGDHAPVILADARTCPPTELADNVAGWIQSRRGAVVIVFEVGKVGEGSALDELLARTRADAGIRLWAGREVAEALAGSRMAVVASRDNRAAADAMVRLAHAFTGNVRFIDLLWNMNEEAIRSTDSDRRALEAHSFGGPVVAELNSLKSKVEMAKGEIQHLKNHIEWVSNDLAWHRDALAATRQFAEQQMLRNAELEGQHHAALALLNEQNLALRQSFAYRFAMRFEKFCNFLAPSGSPQRWVGRKIRHGCQVLRNEGIGSFTRWLLRRHS